MSHTPQPWPARGRHPKTRLVREARYDPGRILLPGPLCQDCASGIVDECGPKSPGSHRVVWGLISRTRGPGGLSSGFPFARRVRPLRLPSSGFPASGVLLGFPFVRRSPVRALRPSPGAGFPSVSRRVPSHLSRLYGSAAAKRCRRRLVPGGKDQGHQHAAGAARSAVSAPGVCGGCSAGSASAPPGQIADTRSDRPRSHPTPADAVGRTMTTLTIIPQPAAPLLAYSGPPPL
jgi:hypothetical protein